LEAEVRSRISLSRVIQKLVADIDRDHLETRPGGHMRRRGARAAAKFEDPPRSDLPGHLDEPVIAPDRSEGRRADRCEYLVESMFVLKINFRHRQPSDVGVRRAALQERRNGA